MMKWCKVKQNTFFIISSVVIITVFYIRVRLLATPLERDEGEYAYIGQLILRGLLPYTDAINLKFPGIFFIYAVVLSLLPDTPEGIHLALLATNFSTALLVFFIGKRLFNGSTALIAAISFLVTTVNTSIHGLWANSEHFVMLFVCSASLLMLRKVNGSGALLSGFLLCLATLVKQHGILFMLFGALFIAFRDFKATQLKRVLQNQLCFFLGVSAPVITLFLWLTYNGNMEDFRFWTLEYAARYATVTSIDPEMYSIFFRFAASAPVLILLAAAGVTALFFRRQTKTRNIFLIGFFVFSVLAMSPGLLFRPHYYILLIPSLSLLLGAGIYSLFAFEYFKEREHIFIPLILLSVSSPLFLERTTFFEISPRDLSRKTFGANPFPESLPLSSYLKKSTRPNEKIAVIGSEPQIYFYANRIAATRYILTYPLMETHRFAARMQREFIKDIELSEPEYIVFVNVATSWLRQERSHDLLFKWFPDYIKGRYVTDGIIDIISDKKTIYIFGDEAASYKPRSRNSLEIYKKIYHSQ